VPPDNNFLLELWPLIFFMALECQSCIYFGNSIQAGRYGYVWMHVFMTASKGSGTGLCPAYDTSDTDDMVAVSVKTS